MPPRNENRRVKLARRPMPPNRRALIYLYSRVPFLIRRVEQLATTIHTSVANGGPTLAQAQLLTILDRCGTLSQSDLARLSGSDTSTMSLVIGNLAERKDIERMTDPMDQRRKLVAISDRGRRSLATATPGLEEAHRLLLEPVAGSVEALADLLGKVAKKPQGPSWVGASAETSGLDVAALASLFTSPIFLVRRTMQVMDAISSEQLAQVNVTIRQIAALMMIFDHPGIGEADLARYAGFETSNVSFLVRLLGRKGYIERHAPSSRGRKGYRISPAGWEIIRQAGPALVRSERKLLEPLTAPEIDTLRGLLTRIVSGAHGQFSTMPLFRELTADPQWPIPAAELDFETLASMPRDNVQTRSALGASSSAGTAINHERHGVLQLIKWTELAVRSEIEQLLAPVGITPQQLLMLGVLADAPGLSSADLARMMGLTPQSVQAHLLPLQTRRLIVRRTDPTHARRQQLSITPSGQHLVDAGHTAIAPLEEKVLGLMSAADRNKLRSGLLLVLSRIGLG